MIFQIISWRLTLGEIKRSHMSLDDILRLNKGELSSVCVSHMVHRSKVCIKLI